MKNLFIPKKAIVLILACLCFNLVYSKNNHDNSIANTQLPAAAKPKQLPGHPAGFRMVPRKPTKEDTILMRDKSLNGQYKYLLTKIYHYQEPQMASLWKTVQDTINFNKRKLGEATGKINQQKKIIDSLNSQISNKDQSLSASNTRVNDISMFGILIPKSAYNLLMWGLVLLFGVTAAVVILRSGSYSREAKYRINLYNELDEEYKSFKAKANEKEKKLARELQTERNKVDELMGRA